jgi:bacterioferritin-associated ferredoxin
MIVCSCKGVNDRRIHDEIRRGAGTLRAIQQHCQAGTDCGACVHRIRQMLAAAVPDVREQSESRSSGQGT